MLMGWYERHFKDSFSLDGATFGVLTPIEIK
jgi:hypothetical protein